MLLTEAEAWADFYLVGGASAAVLIGLLFVALSINREAVAAHAHFRGQARQAIYALVYAFVISLVVLIPDQADWALGAELLCGALLNLVVAIPRQVRGMTTTPPTARRKFALVIALQRRDVAHHGRWHRVDRGFRRGTLLARCGRNRSLTPCHRQLLDIDPHKHRTRR